MKNYFHINLILNFFYFFTFFFTLLLSFDNELYYLIFLQITFLLCEFFYGFNSKIFLTSLGLSIFKIISIIRFIISPFILILTKSYFFYGQVIDINYYYWAILVMIIELILSNLLIKYLFSKKNNVLITYKKKVSSFPLAFYLFYFVISILLLYYLPSLFSNFSIVFFDVNNPTISFFRGFDIRVLIFSESLFFLFNVFILHSFYKKNKNFIFILFAFSFLLINLIIVRSENRATLLFDTIASLYILFLLFKIPKIHIFLFSILSLSIIIFISIQRQTFFGINGIEDLDKVSLLLQSYFAGPSYVAMGLEMFTKSIILLNFELFLTDILIWSGYLGNFLFENGILPNLGSSYFYNLYIYGNNIIGSGDQIIPLSIQGLSNFGILGLFIYQPIGLFIFHKIDCILKRIQYIEVKYFLFLIYIPLALLFAYNISIISLYIFDRFFISLIFMLPGIFILRAKGKRLFQ